MATDMGNGRSTREIESELDRTRLEMANTLDAIESRLNPSELVDTSIDYLRQGPAAQYVRNLGATASDNPIPVTLVAIGLAWLAATGRGGQMRATGRGERLAEMRESARERSAEMSGRARANIEEARHRMRASRERAGAAGRELYGRAEEMGRGLGDLLEQHPIVMGVATMAIGALFGAAFPTTRTEEESFGPQRDAMMRRAEETVGESAEKARHVAERATETARQEAQNPEHQEKDLAQRAQEVAGSAAEAARETKSPEQSSAEAAKRESRDKPKGGGGGGKRPGT